jgi:hypothetical protein
MKTAVACPVPQKHKQLIFYTRLIWSDILFLFLLLFFFSFLFFSVRFLFDQSLVFLVQIFLAFL